MASKNTENKETLEDIILNKKREKLDKFMKEEEIAIQPFLNVSAFGITPSARLVSYPQPKEDVVTKKKDK